MTKVFPHLNSNDDHDSHFVARGAWAKAGEARRAKTVAAIVTRLLSISIPPLVIEDVNPAQIARLSTRRLGAAMSAEHCTISIVALAHGRLQRK